MPFKLKSWVKGLGLATAAVSVAVSVAVMSADHGESPGTDADPAADIADVFFFRSPEAANRMVGAITFGNRPLPRSRIDASFYCDPNILYTYNIDRANAAGAFDNVPDIQVFIRFARSNPDTCGMQLENVPGAGGTFSGSIEQIFSTANGIRGFAGLRNDPFFFDFIGFTALLDSFAGPGRSGTVAGFTRRDAFAGRNASTVVFEMDIDALAPMTAGGTRPQVRVWATTARLAG